VFLGITRKVPPDECVQKTQSGDTVAIHYEGSLEDGTIFDSSYERDQPLEFVLGSGQVIRGWDQGLQKYVILSFFSFSTFLLNTNIKHVYWRAEKANNSS